MKRPLALLIAALLLTGLSPAQAEEPGFMRGYAQALLDADHAALGLEAREQEPPGSIVVSSSACLDAEQQQSIRERLTATGPIVGVEFDPPCDDAIAAAPVSAAAPDPADVEGWTLLPETDVFRPLQADPREPRFALGLQYYELGNDDFVVGEVTAGETVSLVEGPLGEGTWQIGVQGGVFSIFDQERESNDLLNVDYLVALPVSYRRNEWSARGRIYHISSHLGDELILNQNVRERLDISYEAVDLLVSRDFERLRLYGGGGYIIRTTEGIDRSMLQGGTEWLKPRAIWGLDLALGADLKAWDAQDWTLNQSYQAALILTRNQQEIRFLAEYYRGDSFNGQFLFDELEYIGLGVRFGL